MLLSWETVPPTGTPFSALLLRLCFVCMVWGHPRAFFFPVTTVQDFPCYHCPLFYIVSFS